MFARFFVDRPIFATVLSVVIVLIGIVALTQLPIAQYPEVTPPTVSVSALYPGANAKTVAETVATPIEQEVNGVENMLYMTSRCTNDGQMTLDVTFKLGTNLDFAQVLVQNRVKVAEAKLPEEVNRQGVTIKKKSPSILLCINLVSPEGRYDQLYLSNFATLQIKDALARLDGIGDVTFLGPRDYSMRIWLDPTKLATRNLTAGDVVGAIREQNVQVAAGRLGQPPTPAGQDFQLTINTQGRLIEASEFAHIIVKTGDDGRLVYVKDLVRPDAFTPDGRWLRGVELGAQNYDVNSYLGEKGDQPSQPCITIAMFQLPGSNALATAEAVRAEMRRLRASSSWIDGIDYRIVYDTTVFVDESIHEVYKTLFEAFVLVFIVVLVFLQDWRATLLPMIDVPVSLIGTFAVMALLGFSLNNLSLFGLVLAIGIVVDDAIVVVENIERWMAKGLPPREATIKAMDEITGPVIAITLVLCSVFIPTAFLAGISGQFYRQFALTIAASTIISAINALTMAPARAVTLIKPHSQEHDSSSQREALPRLGIILLVGLAAYYLLQQPLATLLGITLPGAGHGEEGSHASPPLVLWSLRLALFAGGAALGWLTSQAINRTLLGFFAGFNRVFAVATRGYGTAVQRCLRVSIIMLVVYAGLIGLTVVSFNAVPKGFIPDQDKGYLVVSTQLPDGASLERSEEVVARLSRLARTTEGVAYTIDLPGYSPLLSTNISNMGGMFVVLEPFEKRKGHAALSARQILRKLRQKFSQVQEARVAVFGAPPVDGLGTTGGFKLQIQDRSGAGLEVLQGGVENVAEAGNAQPGLVGLFTTFNTNQPQLYLNIDRVKAKVLKVSLNDVNETLQAYLGSVYVNDFTRFNRNWQVKVQADATYRLQPEDIGRLEVRNADGNRVPLSTLVAIREVTGPAIVNHFNLYPSAEISGSPAPGYSSGQAIDLLEAICKEPKVLPSTLGFQWTELTYQQLLAEQDVLSKLIFPLAVVFVFLVLAAQYESWSLPLAIILIVPMCLLAAFAGIWLVGLDNNLFTQIGLVVLVGLAAKNAILIVEFAKERQAAGLGVVEATVEAAQVRLRPILMTSFAFILGVVPLVLAKGAGAEMRTALGIAVFSGMLGVTFFGLFFTPVFYSVIRRK